MNDVNVFIAFSKKETALAIAKMVISSGYRVVSVSTNIVDTIHNVSTIKMELLFVIVVRMDLILKRQSMTYLMTLV